MDIIANSYSILIQSIRIDSLRTTLCVLIQWKDV